MMTYQVNPSMPSAKPLISERSSNFTQRGLDAARYPMYKNFGMRSGGGQTAFRQSNRLRRTFPTIQPLSKSRDGKDVVSSFIVGGSSVWTKEDKHKSDLVKDISGRHFVFDTKFILGGRLERAKTVIPPLPRDFHGHRPGNLHPFRLSKELSHSHAGRPLTLGYPEKYQLNTNPDVVFPSTLVLNGRNTFSVENGKLNRPKVDYPMCNLLNVKVNQKSQSYPDPMVRASPSFIQRISELSSLEGETVRQEKLKKIRKTRKPPS
ncbi:putative uncharacterized protein C8orf89 homolog [Mastacembelus armatus]|uniref:putative uncharacterized protein C8orf89 homolog n=1 Tax=Mastacembelus armatus TaxID=205130 RepID=UPI000E463672|nr:uncharacterized protein LOC113121768 [Mastacembelus armatus]